MLLGWVTVRAAAKTVEPSARAHAHAREKGVLSPLYRLARIVLTLQLRPWFRLRVSGVEHIPAQRAAIIAPNHKSFLDAFFIGLGGGLLAHRHKARGTPRLLGRIEPRRVRRQQRRGLRQRVRALRPR